MKRGQKAKRNAVCFLDDGSLLRYTAFGSEEKATATAKIAWPGEGNPPKVSSGGAGGGAGTKKNSFASAAHREQKLMRSSIRSSGNQSIRPTAPPTPSTRLHRLLQPPPPPTNHYTLDESPHRKNRRCHHAFPSPVVSTTVLAYTFFCVCVYMCVYTQTIFCLPALMGKTKVFFSSASL